MIQEKTVSWHIPRASLSSSSSSSGSNYNGSVKKFRRNSAPFIIARDDSCEMKYFSQSELRKFADRNVKKLEPDKRRNSSCHVHLSKFKGGSHSSQGSSISNNSTSSYQLTVANLENFLKFQENDSKPQNFIEYNNDIMFKEDPNVICDKELKESTTIPITDHRQNLVMNFKNMSLHLESNHLQIPKNIKESAEDSESIASSTHFTVVNGFGTPSRFKESRKLCSPYNQITVLIVTMTIFFTVGIIVIIYMMEMRAREMPRS